ELQGWLAAHASLPPPDVPPAAGEVVDHHRAELGRGAAAFERACAALRRWEMFRLGWVELHPADAPIRAGTTVGVLVRVLGLWWLNPCRIVALVEDGGALQRFGLVYRTLAGHAERGEERFVREWRHHGRVGAADPHRRSRPRASPPRASRREPPRASWSAPRPPTSRRRSRRRRPAPPPTVMRAASTTGRPSSRSRSRTWTRTATASTTPATRRPNLRSRP